MHIKLLFLNQIIDDNCFTTIQKQLFSYRNILVPANLIDNYEGRDQSHFYIQHFRHIKHRACYMTVVVNGTYQEESNAYWNHVAFKSAINER